MYHIKNDKRAYNSAELISEALYKCLEEKEYEYITVTDLKNKSTVSRATFYRLFDNIDDVFTYQINKVLDSERKMLLKRVPFDLLKDFILSVIENKDLLQSLIKANKIGLLANEVGKRIDILEKKELLNGDPLDTKYVISIFSAIVSSSIMIWVSSGSNDVDELCHKIRNSLSIINKTIQ